MLELIISPDSPAQAAQNTYTKKISVAVRHYFGHFELGEEGSAEESEAAEGEGEAQPGESEIENAPAVVEDAEVEAENSAEVLEEIEGVEAAEQDSEPLPAIEQAIENVPDAGEQPDEIEEGNGTEDKQAAEEEGA